MKDSNRILIYYNAIKGKLKMDAPYSKYLIFCIATGILLLFATPFVHAIAPNGLIH